MAKNSKLAPIFQVQDLYFTGWNTNRNEKKTFYHTFFKRLIQFHQMNENSIVFRKFTRRKHLETSNKPITFISYLIYLQFEIRFI